MGNELRDIRATEIAGVQIGTLGHKLWVCVDGTCVLRINSPEIELTDLRSDPKNSTKEIMLSRHNENMRLSLQRIMSLASDNSTDRLSDSTIEGINQLCQTTLVEIRNELIES